MTIWFIYYTLRYLFTVYWLLTQMLLAPSVYFFHLLCHPVESRAKSRWFLFSVFRESWSSIRVYGFFFNWRFWPKILNTPIRNYINYNNAKAQTSLHASITRERYANTIPIQMQWCSDAVMAWHAPFMECWKERPKVLSAIRLVWEKCIITLHWVAFC